PRAALRAHPRLRLVALVEEPAHVLHLEVEVVPLRLGAHLHFLDLDRRLLLARFLEAPGLRVLVLAEVHDPADGRLGLRRHFDQIELALARRLQRLLDRHDPELFAVGADHAHFTDTDSFIDTDLFGLTDRQLLLAVRLVVQWACVAGTSGGRPPGQGRPTVRS